MMEEDRAGSWTGIQAGGWRSGRVRRGEVLPLSWGGERDEKPVLEAQMPNEDVGRTWVSPRHQPV